MGFRGSRFWGGGVQVLGHGIWDSGATGLGFGDLGFRVWVSLADVESLRTKPKKGLLGRTHMLYATS